MASDGFEGFTRGTLPFLSGLAAHNEKAWFDAHREAYDDELIAPAKKFVEAMGVRLRRLDKNVVADPRVNGSIMRINRDVRFSKDKSPYKANLDIAFFGGEKGWDRACFFFRLAPHELMLGAGMHHFEKGPLDRYRAAVLDEKQGKKLVAVVEKLEAAKLEIGGEHYKRPPAGVAKDHPRAKLLQHDALFTHVALKVPKELTSAKLVDLCDQRWTAMAPLYEWLQAAL